MKKTRLLLSTLAIAFLSAGNLMAQIPDSLFIVGSATPTGWSLDNAKELTQDPGNPDQFIYDGYLIPGEFKFPVNRNGDWAQDFYMMDPVDPAKMYLHVGGAADDSKWTIAEGDSSLYHVVLNFTTMGIEMTKIEIPANVYLLGSIVEPNWDLDAGLYPLVRTDNKFSITEDLSPGELKFFVNRASALLWDQEMYMKDTKDTTKFYLKVESGLGDSKWEIAEAGNYTIEMDFEIFAISFTKNYGLGINASDNIGSVLMTNLVKDQLRLNISGQVTYSIYNLTGSLISNGTTNESVIKINELTKGLYILQCESSDNKKYVEKFVRQ